MYRLSSWEALWRSSQAQLLRRTTVEMIAGEPKIKTGTPTIETTTMSAGRNTTFVPRTATTSATITRKTSGSGASIPIAVTISVPANESLKECG